MPGIYDTLSSPDAWQQYADAVGAGQPPMTPQLLAAQLPSMSDDQIATLPHALLYMARQYLSPEQQDRIAPFEHRAFAREATSENNLMALPIAAGTLAYQPYKAMFGARSSPSFHQLMQGLIGVWEGLRS